MNKTNTIQTIDEYNNHYFSKGGNVPPCIKNILIPPNEFNQDSFLYKIINNKNNKIYLGSHLGLPLVNYFHSSLNDEFLKDLNETDANFTYEVMEWGDYNNILKKETQLLKKINAKFNFKFYNGNNGFTKPLQNLSVETMAEFADSINNTKKLTYDGQTFERVKSNKKCLKEFEKLQIRYNTIDTDHKNTIKNKINDLGGNTEHLTVVVLDYNDKKTKKIIIGGIHTTQAILECKAAQDVYILYIPEEVHKNFSQLEIDTLASFLNKRPEHDRLPNSNDDLVEMALKYLNQGYSQASPEMKILLTKNNLDSKNRKRIIDKAVRKYKASKNPVNWINYTSGQDKTDLLTRVSLYNDLDTGMYCNSVSSGAAKNVLVEYRYVINYNHNIIKNKSEKKLIRNFKIIIYHPTPEDQNKWENGLANINRQAIQYGLLGFESQHNLKINFTIDYMDTTRPVTQIKKTVNNSPEVDNNGQTTL